MKLLLDTHLLLWAAGDPSKLSGKARKLLDDPEDEHLNNELYLSPHFLDVYGIFYIPLNESYTY